MKKHWGKRLLAGLLVLCMMASNLPVYAFAASDTGTEPPVIENITPQETTAPSTVPQETDPQTTEPQATEPQTTVPQVTEPQSTVPQSTVPQSTVPQSTVPQSTVPQSTVPQSTVPQTTVPQITVPQGSASLPKVPILGSGLTVSSPLLTSSSPNPIADGTPYTAIVNVMWDANSDVVDVSESMKLYRQDSITPVEGYTITKVSDTQYEFTGIPADVNQEDLRLMLTSTDDYTISGPGGASMVTLKPKGNGTVYEVSGVIKAESRRKTATFTILWDDLDNATNRRPRSAYRAVSVYISDDDPATQDILIREAQISVLESGASSVKCLIEDLPAKLDEGCRYVLFLDSSVFGSYVLDSGSGTEEDPLPTLEITPDAEQNYAADKPFTLRLPAYDFTFTVSGLEGYEAAAILQDILLEDEACEYAKLTEEGKIKGLFTTLSNGAPAKYTLNWLSEIGNYKCVSHTENTLDIESSGSLELVFAPKFAVSEETATSELAVEWFEYASTYQHGGQLKLSIPVTVGDNTITVEPKWESGKYVHHWSTQNLIDLGITGNEDELLLILNNLPPLTITDEGDPSSRTLTASMPKEITVPGATADIRESFAKFSLGQISVNDVVFSAPANATVQDYAVGTAPDGSGTVTLYPMTYVDFKFDIRSGEEKAIDVLNYLSSINAVQLRLQDSVNYINTPLNAPIASGYFENNFGISITDYNTTSITDKNASYSLLLPLYDTNKNNIVYTFNSVNGEIIPLENGDWYRVEYDNTRVPGHGTHTDQTYEDGTMIFTRVGLTGFSASKFWADDGREQTEQKRPSATFTLWRYTTNGGDYTSSAQVEIPLEDGTYANSIPVDTTQKSYTLTIENVLDKYDPEGYPYVYFFRESLPAGNYEKIYGAISEGPTGSQQVTDYVPYGERNDDDTSIYNGNTITNHITKPITLTATMEWKAAYYQDRLEDMTVVLTLKAKHADPVGDPALDAPFVVETFELDQFDAFHVYQTVSTDQDLYDSHGHELTYWWEVTSVAENDTVRDITLTEDTGSTTFVLPMNEETIKIDSYSDLSTEYFTISIGPDEYGDTLITALLEGTTEYWVKKSWSTNMQRVNISFSLRIMNKNGQVTTPDGETINPIYTIPADSPYYHGTQVSDWIQAYSYLPKYDENGNRLSYVMTEISGKFFSRASYGRDVDGDDVIEANSLYVHNTQDPGVGRHIDVRKVWLDDSAATDRAAVYVHVYTADGTLVYGTEGNVKGLIDEDPLVITASNEWMLQGVGVTLFNTADGLSPRLTIPEGVDELAYKQQHLYQGGYYIKEMGIGSLDNPIDPDYVTEAGYHTIVYGDTRYVVKYSGTDPINCANAADSEGYYTITNLRIGTINMDITKDWLDDGTIDRSLFAATLTISCTDETGRLFQGEDDIGYAYVDPAVYPGGKQPISDGRGNPVGKVQSIPYDTNRALISFYDLPLYDETGKILHYEVIERMPGSDPDNPGSYTISSTPVEYDDSGDPGVIQGTQHLTNVFQNIAPVYFDLLWLDAYRSPVQRPDVYLHLYNTVHTYDDEGNIIATDIVRHSFLEYKWSGMNNQKQTEDWWRYTFPSLPEYDDHGQRITYYTTLNSHVNTGILDYLAPQYASGDTVSSYNSFAANAMSSVAKDEDGNYVVSYQTDRTENGLPIVGTYEKSATETLYVLKTSNTFVMQLKNDVTIIGHKSWKNIPFGFPSYDLPLLTFKLYRDLETLTTTDDTNTTPESECVAAVLSYESPTLDYSFTLRWYGINDALGNLVDQDTIVMDVDGTEKTALEAWVAMTGLDASLYGKPLPKYDDLGRIYNYSIIETVANFKGTAISVAYQDLNTAISGYDITNTYNIGLQNSRPIQVTKLWHYPEGAMGGNFRYPEELEFTLYRFVKIDKYRDENDPDALPYPVYSVPETVATATLSAEEAAAATVKSFGEQLIYAPNGNPYIYFIAEKQLPGYNNHLEGFPSYALSTNIVTFAEETDVQNWPMDSVENGYWYSNAFTLSPNDTDNSEENADLKLTNDYTALDQTSFSGSKIWNDYNNVFLTRPDTLTVTLYRQTANIPREAVAVIELDSTLDLTDPGNALTVTPDDTNLNVTSVLKENTITADLAVSGNVWSFTVNNLDGYASTGEKWVYSVQETVPEHYTAANNGISNAANQLVNNNYTTTTITKTWSADINPDIEHPGVTVKLQVSTDGATWADASTVFGDLLGEYAFEKTADASNFWKAVFADLPIGTGTGEDYVAYTYRGLETAIGGTPVTYEDETAATPIGFTSGDYMATNNGTAITNSAAVTSLTVAKQWKEDSNNGFGTRNGNWTVSFHIYRDYTDAQGVVVSERLKNTYGVSDFVLTITGTNEENVASTVVENLPACTPDGRAYTYRAVELNPNGQEVQNNRYNGTYAVTYLQDGNASEGHVTVVENQLIEVEVTVTKTWTDSEAGTIRPEDLDLILYRNGVDISSQYSADISWQDTDTDTWTHSYLKLPKYDTNGVAIQYTIGEKVQPGYRNPVIITEVPSVEGYFQYAITNDLTHLRLNKVDSTDLTQELNGVTLVFTSTAAISVPDLAASHFFRLTWTRDENGDVSHAITYGPTADTCATAWLSGGEDIYGLPQGTYKLTDETVIPTGYYASALNAAFTLSSASGNNGNGQILSASGMLLGQNETQESTALLTVKNAKTLFSIVKWDENDQPISEGWRFLVSPVAGSRFAEIAEESLPFSAGDTQWVGQLIVGNVYMVQEVLNPDGYILSDETVYFKLDESNTVVLTDETGTALPIPEPDTSTDPDTDAESSEPDIAVGAAGGKLFFRNLPFSLTIRKENTHGEALDGAIFKLYDLTDDVEVTIADGSLIETVTNGDTSGTVTLVSSLMDPVLVTGHTYRLVEDTAPIGYILPDDAPAAEFTVNSDGTLTPADGNDASFADNTFTFTNTPIALTLTKYDSGDRTASAAPMDGVTFHLFDLTTDESVGEAITHDGGIITFGIGGDLQVYSGHQYLLSEDCPVGYTAPADLTFTVLANGTIQIDDETHDGYELVGTTGLKAVNQRKTGTVVLTKTDLTGASLDKIVFQLYRLDENEDPIEKFLDLFTGKNYILDGTYTWDNAVIPEGNTGTTGILHISGLDWGTYKLVEAVADGFILPTGVEHIIHINETTVEAEIPITVSNEPNQLIVHKVNEEGMILSGAEYALYYVVDKDGNAIERQIPNDTDSRATWQWSSTTGTGHASCLTEGTYKLVETAAPSGYRIGEDIYFTMDAYGVVRIEGSTVSSLNEIPLIEAVDTLTRFTFHKQGLYNETCADPELGTDPNAAKPLAGVTFTAYADAQLTNPIMSAVSDRSGLVEFIGLPLGVNYIRETETVAGYVLDPTVYIAEVTSDESIGLKDLNGSTVADNTLTNDVFRSDLTFTKVSELDNSLVIPGAVYGIYRDGKLLRTAQSGADGQVSFAGLLMDTEYTVTELETPAGSYLAKHSVKVIFSQTDGEIRMEITNNGSNTLVKDENGLLWLEPQTVVSILKTDETGKALPGAKLQICDPEGNPVSVILDGKRVDSWISGTEAIQIVGQLEAGAAYQLVELEAPEGYQLADPVKFTLPDKAVAPNANTVVNVTMKNSPIPVAPPTGDTMQPMFWLALLTVSILGLAAQLPTLFHKKRFVRK